MFQVSVPLLDAVAQDNVLTVEGFTVRVSVQL